MTSAPGSTSWMACFTRRSNSSRLISFPLERGQELVGKGFVEVGADPDSALQPTGPAGLAGHSDQLRDRPSILRDDDLFSLGHSLEKTGEMGLGVVDVEGAHAQT